LRPRRGADTVRRQPTERLVLSILFQLAQTLLNLYKWAVILAAVVQTLISFGVLDTRNRLVWSIADFLERLTDPALRRIRRFVPFVGGIDLSYIVLLLVIWVLQMLLLRIYAALAFGDTRGLML
jgi:YggT family protein